MPILNRNRRLGCPPQSRLGQSASLDIPQGYLADSTGTPNVLPTSSVYDTIYNDVSGAAENIWNDVQAAGVWAGNEVSAVWQDLQNPGAIPGNPISAGYAAGQQDRATIGQDISNIGSGIGSGITAIGSQFIIIGGLVLAAILLIEKD
jgi:hypothetical protein